MEYVTRTADGTEEEGRRGVPVAVEAEAGLAGDGSVSVLYLPAVLCSAKNRVSPSWLSALSMNSSLSKRSVDVCSLHF